MRPLKLDSDEELKAELRCELMEIACVMAEHNETEARPFIWRADPDAIVASRNRGFQALGVPGWVSSGGWPGGMRSKSASSPD